MSEQRNESSAAQTPDPGSFGGHPYTPEERKIGYGTDHDPRFTSSAATCPGCGRPVEECQAEDVDESFPASSAATALPRPYFEDDFVKLYLGDALDILPLLPAVDVVVTDPPYGETSLAWDVRVNGWLRLLRADSLWCFGSLRSFMAIGHEFTEARWSMSQDVVWEKHNGSSFHADRFKRVHEAAAHFYRGAWGGIYHEPPKTMDATKRTLRRKHRPPHTGHIEQSAYASEDGGPKLMRSVLYVRSAHGTAVHPTQKPEGILRPLIEYACPPEGCVLDPFAGSGSTGLAARQLGREALLIEKDERYAEAAARRLSQMELVA